MSSLYNSVGEAQQALTQYALSELQRAIQTLLQTKHLYQSVELSSEAVLKHVLPYVSDGNKEYVKRLAGALGQWTLVAEEQSLQELLASSSANTNYQLPRVRWKAPDVKMFCRTCDRIEPFNAQSSQNLLNRLELSKPGVFHNGAWHQVYVLTYLCQSCKSVPEVFVVRRQGVKLTLSGRTPMEHAQVPKAIPKEINKFYSGAVIAHQSGQTLAAIFMLRTACEQWSRLFADKTDRADAAMDKYMASLPEDFKSRFPSLQKMYSDLSVAIHEAKASEDLYLTTINDLERHFKARDLYELTVPATDKSMDAVPKQAAE